MSDSRLTAAEVLRRYQEEDLPEFVERTLNDVNQVGLFGNRPLHVAAIRGQLDEMAALLDGGADVNAVGEGGNTALHEAAGQGHAEAVAYLLEHGADRDVRNEDGSTALDVARLGDRDEIAKLLTSLARSVMQNGTA